MNLNATKYSNPSRLVDGNVTVYATDVILRVNTTSQAATINLPAIPVGYFPVTWRLYVYDINGNAATNNITIVAGTNTDGTAQTINGAATLVISTNGARAIIEISSNTSFNALLSASVTQAYTTIENEGVAEIQRSTMNFVGAGVTASDDGVDTTTITIPGGITQAYTRVEDEGSPLTQRSTLDFVGAGVTASDIGSKTTVTIPGGITQAYQTFQDEGSSVTQRSTADFVGAGVSVADSGGKTVITIPGGYTTVEDEGTPVTQRATMNFVGGGVTVTDVSSKTTITIPTQQAYNTVEDEGTPLTQRSSMNFVGGGVTVTDVGSKTTVTIPSTAYSYFYARKSLTTSDTSFNIAAVAGGVNSVFGGLQVLEYTSETESGLTFNSSTGEFTVPSSGLYSLNAKFTTRMKADNINSLVNGTGDPWTSAGVETDQIAIAILIERSVAAGSPNMIVCSNKQTINDVNISDVNIECSSLLFNLVTSDIVYVVIFNKTNYTIVNLATQSGLPDCFIDFSCMKIS